MQLDNLIRKETKYLQTLYGGQSLRHKSLIGKDLLYAQTVRSSNNMINGSKPIDEYVENSPGFRYIRATSNQAKTLLN